jgi:parvulin-like peptidyl-prolyl isomerase
VTDTGFFAKDEPISGLGMAPAVADRAFEMKPGEVSDQIRTPQGFAFITVTDTQPSRAPTLDDVKAKVRDDVVKKKAVEAARQKAAAVGAQMKSGDFDAAAKAAGLTVQTTDLVARGAPIGDLGVSPAVDAAAFKLPVNGVSDPIVTDNGAAIVKVLEKKDVSATEMASAKNSLRDQLLNERRNRFYSAYMGKAREKMKINVNRSVLAQLTA